MSAGYVVQPPFVPKNPEYADQRYFTRAYRNFITGDCSGLSVYRIGTDNETNVSFEVGEGRNKSARVDMKFNAEELRFFAFRLLDAAHDIEAFPPSVLMGGDIRAGAMVEPLVEPLP